MSHQDAQTDQPHRDEDENDEQADLEIGLGPIPFAILVLFEAALAPVALVVGALLHQHPLTDLTWDVNAALAGVLAAVPMLALLGPIVYWPVGPLKRISEYFDEELAPALHGCEWPDLAVLSAAAGVGEEMLFRGVIQGALVRLLGPSLGIVLAGVLFGVLHPVSLSYVVLASVLGMYLGVVWLVCGNLLTVMVAHAVYDFVALVALLHARAAAHEGDNHPA